MKRARMKKKRGGMLAALARRPFAMLAVCLLAMMMLLVVNLPKRMDSLDRQDEQLRELMGRYSEKQSELNSIRSEVALTGEDDYIERIARRELGFSWYGETIYKVDNLEEIRAQAQKLGNN